MRVLTTVTAAGILALAGIAGGAGSARADGQAMIRLAYLAPDAAAADAYVDAARALSGVTYKTVSTYMPITPGTHSVQVRAAGAASTSSPWASLSQAFSAGASYTVVVGGRFGKLQAAAFQDGFSAPGQGQAVARFVHMAPDVPAVDVAVKGGAVIFSNIAFLQASQYKPFPAGSYDLELRATGTGTVLFSATGVVAASGTIHSLTGIGGVGSPVELLPILDAGAVSVVPQGGATTGGGGMAPGAPAGTGAAGVAAVATALLLLLLPRVRRGRGGFERH